MKPSIHRRTFLAGVSLAVAACVSRPPRDAELQDLLDRAVQAKIAEHDLPALTVRVWRDGSLLAESTMGVRARGRSVPAQSDDHWHIGSCTKFMTACMIARLVARGRLDWAMTLADALPADLRTHLHPGLRAARLDQLLNHTSGMVDPPETVSRSPIGGPLATMFLDEPNADIRAARQGALLALRTEPWRAPGEAFRYSNWAYITAGVIASEVEDESYFALMRREVFRPLGMRHADFGPPGDASLNQPWGHIAEPLEGVPLPPGPTPPDNMYADFPRYVSPAGLLSLPLESWGRFLHMALAGFRGESAYLPREQFDKLFATLNDEDANVVAMGIKVFRSGDGRTRILTHSGSNLLWRADYRLFPVTGRIFAMASNTGAETAQTAFDELSDLLIRELSRREGKTFYP